MRRCDIQLDHPLEVESEARIAGDRVYQFFENTRLWQQLSWAILYYGLGGYLITMEECWHNNHHAFPDSAQLGLHFTQSDPGWWFIQLLQHMGLVWDVQQPNDLPTRETLKAFGQSSLSE